MTHNASDDQVKTNSSYELVVANEKSQNDNIHQQYANANQQYKSKMYQLVQLKDSKEKCKEILQSQLTTKLDISVVPLRQVFEANHT